jgi:hypothetical protein
MSNTEKISLWVAGLGIVGMVATTTMTGFFQSESNRAQIEKDVHLVMLQATLSREKLVREKYEAFISELSDLISFLDNSRVVISEAKEKLSRVRKLAFALSAYADPALSQTALLTVEAVNNALTPRSEEDAKAAIKYVVQLSVKLSEEFVTQTNALDKKQLELMKLISQTLILCLTWSRTRTLTLRMHAGGLGR